MIGRRIRQIIPADNWFARFRSNGSAGEHISPLSCWALVENTDGTTQVVGMDVRDNLRVDFPDEKEEFAGYVHRSGALPEKS